MAGNGNHTTSRKGDPEGGGAQLRLRGNEPVYKYLLSKSSATADAAASRCHLTQKSASADAASCCYLTQKSASADAALCCYLLESQLRLMQLRLEAAAPLALLLLCELRATSLSTTTTTEPRCWREHFERRDCFPIAVLLVHVQVHNQQEAHGLKLNNHSPQSERTTSGSTLSKAVAPQRCSNL